MKEPRFIELLNLYVDQQLTAAEATELEAELQRNPSRRRTYQQYCRMQKACTQLFEQECQAAPSTSKLSRALAQADRKVIAFPRPRNVWLHRGVFASGVAAMAACLALVFVRQATVSTRNVAPMAANPTPTITEVAKVEPVAPAIQPTVQTVAIPPADPQTREMRKLYYAVLPVKKFVPVKVVTPNGEAVASTEEKPDFDWMKKLELAPMRPVSAEDLMAETKSQSQEQSNTFMTPRRPSTGMYENAAFQYQKGN
jgi:anti-sigma factor RsiW